MTLIPSEITVYSVLITINCTLLFAHQHDIWTWSMQTKKIKINLWEEEISHISGFSESSPPENLSMAPCQYSHTFTLNSPRKGHVIHCIAQLYCSLAWFWPMPVAISPSNAQVRGQHRPGTFLNRLDGWSYPFLRSGCAVPHTLRKKELALAHFIHWNRHASPPTKQCRKDGLLRGRRSGAHSSWISLPVRIDLTNFFSIKLGQYFTAFCADEILYWLWGFQILCRYS